MKKALLLVGSPKPRGSTSEALGDYILAGLEKSGFETQKANILQLLKGPNGTEQLLKLAEAKDIIIFASPLYIDSTPAVVIRAMEIIAESRAGEQTSTLNQALLAICNCGFPESHHIQPALDIYKFFAKEAGFNWLGGMALGGGGAINGKPLNKAGGMVKNVIKSLDLAVTSIINDQPLSDDAVSLMAKPMMPRWLYLLVGQFSWYLMAKKIKNLNNRPYLPK